MSAALERILKTPLKAQGRNIKVAADGYAVAAVNAHMNDSDEYALVFASSAKMLSALKHLESVISPDHVTLIGHIDFKAGALEVIRNAIAEAEGRTNV